MPRALTWTAEDDAKLLALRDGPPKGKWLLVAAKMGRPLTSCHDRYWELKRLAGDSEFVLPGRGRSTRPFAKNALNKALEGLTFQEMDPLTIHDLRRTGATLLTEKGFNQDVIEKALAHEREGIRSVYIIAEYEAQRREMLQFWADYVEGLLSESRVIVGNFRRA